MIAVVRFGVWLGSVALLGVVCWGLFRLCEPRAPRAVRPARGRRRRQRKGGGPWRAR